MRRVVAALLTVLVAAMTLAGCGGKSSTGTDQPTKKIAVTFHGDSVTPNGERVKVAVGQPIELDVTADKPGQIHVHSSPEQELDYGKGSTVVHVKPIETPGIITVESHALDKVILQLQAQ
jgi:ABC-type uncharacterized transport system auxiliary subunit